MKISIIIPALNEEKYIPKLLESIKKQSFKDYEVIVADAGSTDDTECIARQYGALVVPGGRPAAGRNSGARRARGEILLFLDADVRLPSSFLEKAYDEFEKRFLEVATCEVKPLSNLSIDKVMHEFANLYIRTLQYSDPHAFGCCIFVTRRLFERLGGFNEGLAMSEDHDFVKRASRFRQFRVLDSVKIYLSVRRLRKEGRIALSEKYIRLQLDKLIHGGLGNNAVPYEFARYDRINKGKTERQLVQIELRLRKISRDLKMSAQKYLHNNTLKHEYLEKIGRVRRRLDAQVDAFKRIFLEK